VPFLLAFFVFYTAVFSASSPHAQRGGVLPAGAEHGPGPAALPGVRSTSGLRPCRCQQAEVWRVTQMGLKLNKKKKQADTNWFVGTNLFIKTKLS